MTLVVFYEKNKGTCSPNEFGYYELPDIINLKDYLGKKY